MDTWLENNRRGPSLPVEDIPLENMPVLPPIPVPTPPPPPSPRLPGVCPLKRPLPAIPPPPVLN